MLQGPEEVIKELLGSTVITDHGIMQRLLPVTWTDTNVRPYGRTAPGLRPLLQGQACIGLSIFPKNFKFHSLRRRLRNLKFLGDFEI